jgi:acetyl esterase
VTRSAAVLLSASLASSAWAGAYENVEYSNPSGRTLRFDASIPEGQGPFPAVVIVHGGAWVTGDRRGSVEPLFKPLTNAGYAWFSIDYRLAGNFDFSSIPSLLTSVGVMDEAIEDVRQAVLFIRQNAAKYRIDPSRIALLGESAGAHLASMAALKPVTGSEVQAAIAFYSPSDLESLVQKMPQIPENVRRAVKGTSFAELLLARLRTLSPIQWVRKDAPPFLLVHGTSDGLVPYEQSEEMCAAIKKAGAQCELFAVTGGTHGVRRWEASTQMTAYKDRMTAWLAENLR